MRQQSDIPGLVDIRHCPRCDYDVRTQLHELHAAADDAAAQTVRCPECGLTFDGESVALRVKPPFGFFGLYAVAMAAMAFVMAGSDWFTVGAIDRYHLLRLITWCGIFAVFGLPVLLRLHYAKRRPDSVITADGVWIGGRRGRLVAWDRVSGAEVSTEQFDGPPWKAPDPRGDRRMQTMTLTIRGKGPAKHEQLVFRGTDDAAVEAMRLIRERINQAKGAAPGDSPPPRS